MMNIMKRIPRRSTFALGLLLCLGSSSVLGCSASETDMPATEINDANPEIVMTDEDVAIAPTPMSGNNTKDNASDQQWTSEPIETADLATLTLNLTDAQGKPYGEVRDRIIASGWIPHTFAHTTGPESDFHDSRVQDMERLGFMEVKACSGMGQGFCRFEFVYEERAADNAPILVVTTTAVSSGDPNAPMPNFWSFRQENISDLTYRDRTLDSALLTQLRTQDGFCLGVGQCEQAQYILKDALLIAASGGFGSTQISFVPDTPVSKEDAIAYARILDTAGDIDFDDGQFDSALNTENYYAVGFRDLVEGGAELGGTTTVKLQLTPDGTVSTITFSVIVL